MGAADILDQRILSTIASNLNQKVTRTMGLTFTIVPVPGGAYYTLAAKHQIYMYWGGWVADYNHLLDWLGPMLLASWIVSRVEQFQLYRPKRSLLSGR